MQIYKSFVPKLKFIQTNSIIKFKHESYK